MDLLARARVLRKISTETESLLWQKLRNRQLDDYKFKRQVLIGRYIVDFMCSSAKLVIEVDGGQHAEQQDYDQLRTDFIESKGFEVVRFWNHEVLKKSILF